MIGLGARFVGRIASLARAQNMTTVADFVSARYGKSQAVAAIAALIAVVGSAPYIALQLKAVVEHDARRSWPPSTRRGSSRPRPRRMFSLAIASVLAAFAMAFGTRRINPKEHQNGLILAIAAESLVKLVAFLAVGAFVVWRLNGGIVGLTGVAQSIPRIAAVMQTRPDPAFWIVTTLLSAFAILLLPRQFHVAIVENHDQRDIRTASWLFPAYLVAINLFVAPLAIAGLEMFADGGDRPRPDGSGAAARAGARGLALLTMIGGLSAATAMVVVDSVALAITDLERSRDAAPAARGAPAGAERRGRHRRARAVGCAAWRSWAFSASAMPTSASPGSGAGVDRACCRSPRSRRSRRPFSAACSGGAPRRAARWPA